MSAEVNLEAPRVFVTSDEHYYHHNMLLFRGMGGAERERNFRTTDEMHRVLKKHHNEVVRPQDIVYHLGDFAYGPGGKSWQNLREIVQGLHGQHHLILGNHDHIKPFDYLEAGFISVHTSLSIPFKEGEATLIHDPAVAGVLTHKKFIHGHTHSLGVRLAPNAYCVCVELSDYYPIELNTISFEEV